MLTYIRIGNRARLSCMLTYIRIRDRVRLSCLLTYIRIGDRVRLGYTLSLPCILTYNIGIRNRVRLG